MALLRTFHRFVTIPLQSCNPSKCFAVLIALVTVIYLAPTLYRMHVTQQCPCESNSPRKPRKFNVFGNVDLTAGNSLKYATTLKSLIETRNLIDSLIEGLNMKSTRKDDHAVNNKLHEHRNRNQNLDVRHNIQHAHALHSSNQNTVQIHPLSTTHRPLARKTTNEVKHGRNRNNRVYYDQAHPPALFKKWKSTSESFCGGTFIGYNHDIAKIQNVRVDANVAIGARGGEDFRKLLNQKEDKEFFKYRKGFMIMVCDRVPLYHFGGENVDSCHIASCHLDRWLQSMEVQHYSLFDDTNVIPQYYIAVTR